MPTIGIYVPMGITRTIAERWGVDPDSNLFVELIRSLCEEALSEATGAGGTSGAFDPTCPNEAIHRSGYRCRRCGGR